MQFSAYQPPKNNAVSDGAVPYEEWKPPEQKWKKKARLDAPPPPKQDEEAERKAAERLAISKMSKTEKQEYKAQALKRKANAVGAGLKSVAEKAAARLAAGLPPGASATAAAAGAGSVKLTEMGVTRRAVEPMPASSRPPPLTREHHSFADMYQSLNLEVPFVPAFPTPDGRVVLKSMDGSHSYTSKPGEFTHPSLHAAPRPPEAETPAKAAAMAAATPDDDDDTELNEFYETCIHNTLSGVVDQDLNTRRPRQWLLDAARSVEYFPMYKFRMQTLSMNDITSIFMTLDYIHNGTEAPLDSKTTIEIANRILTEYSVPRGFDTSLALHAQSKGTEKPIRRAERVLVCFLYGMMRRKWPFPGEEHYSRPIVTPFDLRGIYMPLMYTGFMTTREKLNLIRTCRQMYHYHHKVSADSTTRTLSMMMPATLKLPLDLDVWPRRANTMIRLYGASPPPQCTNQEKRKALLRGANFYAHMQRIWISQARCSCCLTIDSAAEYDQLFSVYHHMVSGGGSKTHQDVLTFTQRQAATFMRRIEFQANDGSRCVVVATNCRDTGYPFVVAACMSKGVCTPEQAIERGIKPFVLCLDVLRGLAYVYVSGDQKTAADPVYKALVCDGGLLKAVGAKLGHYPELFSQRLQGKKARELHARGVNDHIHSGMEHARVPRVCAIGFPVTELSWKLSALSFGKNAL